MAESFKEICLKYGTIRLDRYHEEDIIHADPFEECRSAGLLVFQNRREDRRDRAYPFTTIWRDCNLPDEELHKILCALLDRHPELLPELRDGECSVFVYGASIEGSIHNPDFNENPVYEL